MQRENLEKATEQKLLIMYKGSSVRLVLDISSEIIQARKQWGVIFKILKEKSCPQKIPYPLKSLSKIEYKLRHSKVNKNRKYLLLSGLPYKK